MYRVLLIVAACIVGVCPARAHPAEPANPIGGYTVTSWSGSDDTSLGPVRALLQDSSGYLWVGSESGLFRFDGFHFASAEAIGAAALPKLPVRALLQSRRGDIWIGLGDSGGIYRLPPGGALTHVADAPLTGAVSSLLEDRDGAIWIGLDTGLLRYDRGSWQRFGPADGLTSSRIFHLQEAPGHFYVGTADGLFDRGADERFTFVAAAGARPIRGSTMGHDGTLLVTDPVRGFRDVFDDDGRSHGLPGRAVFLLTDRHGRVWVATIGQGLWRLRPGAHPAVERLTLQNGLLSDGIWTLLEDREGNLWVGTHEGLNRLTPYIATPVTDLGITSTVVRGVDQGTSNVMWAASNEGIFRLTTAPHGAIHRHLFPLAGVRTLHADDRGVVWAAAANGVYRLQDDTLSALPSPSGGPLRQVNALTVDGHRDLWMSDVERGLWRLHGTQLQPYQLPEPFRGRRIQLLHRDRHGTLWIALAGGTLLARQDETFIAYDAARGVVHDTISAIYDDDTGVWLAGNRGLSHLDGDRFVTLGREQGLPMKRAFGVTTDGAGTLWLALDTVGIVRLTIAEFERAVSTPGYMAHVRVLDGSDGTAGVPTRLDTKTTARSSDGRVWFVTGRGLTIITPEKMRDQPTPSGPVRVEGIVANERPLSPAPDVVLPSGTARLRIDYTALNLTTPERVRFRYRLDGFDDNWQDAGSRRQAFYTNLPPGAYRFRVEADDGAGGMQTTFAEWPFAIEPHVYETGAFYMASVATVLLLVAGAWRFRLGQVRQTFALVLAERGRLSREIHDGLLQTMIGIALKIDGAARRTAQDDLLAIRRDIEDCIVEARRAIWNMRSGSEAATDDLIVALENAGATATSGTAIRFRLNVSGTPRRCSRTVETELLRIAQEALANAVRHAAPANVTMDLSYDRDAVLLRVSDDGRGFMQSTRAATDHFGLLTMRERAEQLGGRFRVVSSTGAGTQIETVIPISSNA